jgi:hypothetical protein
MLLPIGYQPPGFIGIYLKSKSRNNLLQFLLYIIGMVSKGQQVIRQWYKNKNWQQFAFQQEMEEAFLGLAECPHRQRQNFRPVPAISCSVY